MSHKKIFDCSESLKLFDNLEIITIIILVEFIILAEHFYISELEFIILVMKSVRTKYNR